MRPRGKRGGESGLSAARLSRDRRPEVTGVVKRVVTPVTTFPPAATAEEKETAKPWIRQARASLKLAADARSARSSLRAVPTSSTAPMLVAQRPDEIA